MWLWVVESGLRGRLLRPARRLSSEQGASTASIGIVASAPFQQRASDVSLALEMQLRGSCVRLCDLKCRWRCLLLIRMQLSEIWSCPRPGPHQEASLTVRPRTRCSGAMRRIATRRPACCSLVERRRRPGAPTQTSPARGGAHGHGSVEG